MSITTWALHWFGGCWENTVCNNVCCEVFLIAVFRLSEICDSVLVDAHLSLKSGANFTKSTNVRLWKWTAYWNWKLYILTENKICKICVDFVSVSATYFNIAYSLGCIFCMSCGYFDGRPNHDRMASTVPTSSWYWCSSATLPCMHYALQLHALYTLARKKRQNYSLSVFYWSKNAENTTHKWTLNGQRETHQEWWTSYS